MHTANNQAMSGVELTGILGLDERMELKINALANAELDDEEQEGPPLAKKANLSVRDILMAITIMDTDKPLLHMISGASGGSHEGFYPENKDPRGYGVSTHGVTSYDPAHMDILNRGGRYSRFLRTQFRQNGKARSSFTSLQ